MNINDSFPSKYLKAADLKGKKIKLLMANVNEEDLGDNTKPVVYFDGKEKGLVLNKTNAMTIAAFYGADTDKWQGQTLFLYPTKVSFQGQMVDSIRVEVVPEVVQDDKDEIPF